jgi:hypothetical protein
MLAFLLLFIFSTIIIITILVVAIVLIKRERKKSKNASVCSESTNKNTDIKKISDVISTKNNVNNTMCIQYKTTDKQIIEIMQDVQALTTTLQTYGCNLSKIVNIEQLIRKGLSSNYENVNNIPCEEVSDALLKHDDMPSDIKKTLAQLIEKIAKLTCVNGRLDVDKFTQLMLKVKDALCN